MKKNAQDVKVDAADCQNLDRALSLEWLETNGRGGFAFGTVAGANTRRYHALLVAARRPPAERFVLVNHLEEWVDLDDLTAPLSTNIYPGAVHPIGYTLCTGFSWSPWPTWTYRLGSVFIQREVLCVQGRDMVLVRWTLLAEAQKSAVLRIRPMLSGRDYHQTHHENQVLSTTMVQGTGWISWQPYSNVPSVRAFCEGTYRHCPDWYRHVQFPIERERGLDHQEDWWSPGEFELAVTAGRPQTLILTTEQTDALDPTAILKQERSRRTQLARQTSGFDGLTAHLWRASGAFIAKRGQGHTVVAGYPWFTDWGRDTFISLPGLCLVTGRYDQAWHIITSYLAHISEGLVPNRFPDAGEVPEYHSIDASLWFIHAVERYLAYSNDTARVRTVAWPAIKQVLDGYWRGTRYNIYMDRDGLVTGGTTGTQLTWMDAKVGEWVVTPRHGKPVEIQALWMRSLDVGRRLALRFGEVAYAARCRRARELAVRSFRQKFWYDTGGYLYDVIDGPAGVDASMRPNQLYVLALCPDVMAKARAAKILDMVRGHLLTPVGLRTLSPTDPRYRPRYEGGVVERDGAYHQGTVWPFLLGPFVTAWLNVFGRNAKRKAEARSFLKGLEAHLGEACMGQVSEIFDGDAPHAPRGCPAQAWSVAEPLRVLMEELSVPRRSLDSLRTHS
ncbi:MAG: amylo-alpha-1,6-glucosidase [Nitrospira sp.]|nr:amylo-alpha-1,6-glucosidase [Nitrospira sp.]